MKRKKHPSGIPGCPKTRTELRKGWIAGIVVIAVIALLFVGYNLYRYPAMFRSLSDNTLNDAQVEALREEILSQPDVNVLVAYFSYSGTTRNVATALSEKTGGDLFEITPQDSYSNVYMESNSEIRSNARPALTDTVENMEEYDIVFVGYPIWWDEAPAMIATFLAENDFSGKTIIPFCTSSSDDIGNSLHIFSELCPDAEIAEGLTANDLNDIEPWIQRLGLME